MTTSLLLDTATWDLTLDASGNIALASAPYVVAQDVACALRLFSGELWYDTTKGIPYFQQVLGEFPSIALMKSLFEQAAMTIPSVVSAVAYITSFNNRAVGGQVQVTDTAGITSLVSF